MTEPLITQARVCGYHRAALTELASHLPGQDDDLDCALGAAVKARDELAFTHLLLAALYGGRTVDAGHLIDGAVLLPDPDTLGVAATHCSGDVPEALLSAVRSGRMGWEREAAALFLAAWWCNQNCNGEMTPGLLAQARTLARKTVVEYEVQFLLLALSEIVQDEGLSSLLSPMDMPWMRAAARQVAEVLIERSREHVFAHVPEKPEPPILTGYTVRRAVPRIGRNEPCPCGSGKKYKRCCYETDREKLRQSSDLAGVTMDEIRAHPESYLDSRRLMDMRSYELARLDPKRVPPDLHGVLVNRLALFGEHDAVVAFFETVGYHEDLDDSLIEAVDLAAEAAEEKTVRRLLEIRGDRGRQGLEPSLGAQLLMLGTEVGPVLQRLEAEAQTLLEHDNRTALVDFAHGLLASRFPALGMLIARGVLPLAFSLDAGVLLDRLLMTRDGLGLSPQDPIETAVDCTLFDFLDQEEAESASLAEAHQALDAKEAEVERLKGDVAALRDTLEREEKMAAAQDQTPDLATPMQEQQEGPSLAELSRRLAALKNDLKQRHLERNQIWRELLKAREELQALHRERRESGDGEMAKEEEREETLLLPEEAGSTQPIRIPVFPVGFPEGLARFPEAVARGAVRLVGSLAAGDVAAFRGAKRLKINREVWRQKVGSSYRLLFRLGTDTLEVVALVNRQDFERAIKSLD